jgi:hypothetical protein
LSSLLPLDATGHALDAAGGRRSASSGLALLLPHLLAVHLLLTGRGRLALLRHLHRSLQVLNHLWEIYTRVRGHPVEE